MTYYLFRLVNPSIPHFKVSKWEDGKQPTDVYDVFPRTHSCNCVATKRECRHVQCCVDLLDPEFIDQTEHWMWDADRGWSEALDIPNKEMFLKEAMS